MDFTLVEISVSGLVLLQAFKALSFLGFSGVLLQCLTGGRVTEKTIHCCNQQ